MPFYSNVPHNRKIGSYEIRRTTVPNGLRTTFGCASRLSNTTAGRTCRHDQSPCIDRMYRLHDMHITVGSSLYTGRAEVFMYMNAEYHHDMECLIDIHENRLLPNQVLRVSWNHSSDTAYFSSHNEMCVTLQPLVCADSPILSNPPSNPPSARLELLFGVMHSSFYVHVHTGVTGSNRITWLLGGRSIYDLDDRRIVKSEHAS